MSYRLLTEIRDLLVEIRDLLRATRPSPPIVPIELPASFVKSAQQTPPPEPAPTEVQQQKKREAVELGGTALARTFLELPISTRREVLAEFDTNYVIPLSGQRIGEIEQYRVSFERIANVGKVSEFAKRVAELAGLK